MSEPEPFQGAVTRRAGRHSGIFVFVSSALTQTNGPARAGDLMLNGNGKWEDVWHRFRDAPRGYPGLFRNAMPHDILRVDKARQPQVNEDQRRS